MSNLRIRLPIVVAGLFVLLVAVAIWLPISGVGNDPLAGVYALLLGAPWSFLSVAVIDAIDPALMDRKLGVVGVAVGGLINAGIVYWVMKKVVGVSVGHD